MPRKQCLMTTAAVSAAAVVCTQVSLAAPYIGWGLAVARVGETWGQRVLLGQHTIHYADPGWRDELFLSGLGLLSYTNGRPAQGWDSYWLCLPNLALTLVLAGVAGVLHWTVCHAVARSSMPAVAAYARSAFASLLCRWSALGAACVFCLYQALRWFWAGAQRGAVTQAATGERVAEIVFGPVGRAVLLTGAVGLYVAVVLWTARVLLRSAAPGHGSARRWGLPAVSVVGVLLLLFPYLAGWAVPLLGEVRFYELSNSTSGSTFARIIDAIAPAP